MLVVEAVEVVRKPDRVGRDRVRRAALRRLGRDRRELRQPLDEIPLLARQLPDTAPAADSARRVPQDPCDPSVRVLDVVDGIGARRLCSEVDVDLDRLVMTPRDEIPAGRVDTDLVHELVEEHNVPTTLRHLRRLATLRQMDELVEEHLDTLRVVPEHPSHRCVPLSRPVVIGAEHIDRAVEATVELVGEVCDIGCAIRRQPSLLGGADQHPVVVVPVCRRARPQCTVLLIRVKPREERAEPGL